jgi:hypothetical protein
MGCVLVSWSNCGHDVTRPFCVAPVVCAFTSLTIDHSFRNVTLQGHRSLLRRDGSVLPRQEGRHDRIHALVANRRAHSLINYETIIIDCSVRYIYSNFKAIKNSNSTQF